MAGVVLRVRAVRGRNADPYRGAPDDDAAAREARDAEPQPFDTLVAALACLPDVRLERAGRRFTLRRGPDALHVAFATAAPAVCADDATFEGDPVLALEVLHWLVPLFGAVELRAGDFAAIVDGRESADEVAARYRTHWIDGALERARELSPPPPPPAAHAPPRRSATEVERTRKWRRAVTLWATLTALALVAMLIWYARL